MAAEKGEVEACLLDSACWVCLGGSRVLLRHGDAAVGSLEQRCGREGCRRVVTVRVKPLVDASLSAMLVERWVASPLIQESSILGTEDTASRFVDAESDFSEAFDSALWR